MTGGIAQEHGSLLAWRAWRAFETDARLNDEFDSLLLQPFSKLVPFVHVQHHTAVRDGDSVPIDRAVTSGNLSLLAQMRIGMADELVTVQVEVHPPSVAAALLAPEHILVEMPGLDDIPDLHSHMRWIQLREGLLRGDSGVPQL